MAEAKINHYNENEAIQQFVFKFKASKDRVRMVNMLKEKFLEEDIQLNVFLYENLKKRKRLLANDKSND